jgi:hypothetical protein
MYCRGTKTEWQHNTDGCYRQMTIRTDLTVYDYIFVVWFSVAEEMMMSLLWYYQPEHTECGRQACDMENEVFASRHIDANSVACIDDKCYVLTYDQFCR